MSSGIRTFVLIIESMSYLCLKELILCPKGCLEVCLRNVLRFDVADRRAVARS
jgi:hypothetical protein